MVVRISSGRMARINCKGAGICNPSPEGQGNQVWVINGNVQPSWRKVFCSTLFPLGYFSSQVICREHNYKKVYIFLVVKLKLVFKIHKL